MTNNYLLFFASVIYALLPAYIANMAPVFAQRLGLFKTLAKPIDNGRQIFGHDILGKGKTWRGLIVGVVAAIIVVFIQALWQSLGWLESIRLINYFQHNLLLFGFLAGLGALGGDILKSFVKRLVHISSGKAWPVFDQLDFVLGFFILTLPLIGWPEVVVWTSIIITLAGHPVSNMIGYYLKIKKVWW